MATVTHPPKKEYRTIRLPLAESEYDRFLSDRAYAKARLDELYEDYPELFPDAFPWGDAFFGFTDLSIKQQLRCRRIRLDQGYTVFSGAPAFMMPYMTGRVSDVDHALFLMRFHVPPLIESWDIDLATFGMEIVLNRRLTSEPVKQFAFVEREPEASIDEEPGLTAFLQDPSLSGDATEAEIAFLRHLRFKGKRPTPLYYYRALQDFRDPLHFSTP